MTEPFVNDSDFTLYVGDVRDVLAGLSDESVHCVVTSPPYWGLRDYGTGLWDGGDPDCDHDQRRREYDPDSKSATDTGAARDSLAGRDQCRKCGARRVDQQLGLEATPDLYVQNMVAVFREVRRVLRRDGTCWLNLGDSYHGGGYANHAINGDEWLGAHGGDRRRSRQQDRINANPGLKPKDLVGIPWMLAFALRADGWYLRSDIIWSKPNPMPESVTDRPTKAHEYLFLLTRSPRYFYDADAIREPNVSPEQAAHNARYARVYDAHTERVENGQGVQPGNVNNLGIHARGGATVGRNRRSVWEIATEPYPDAHFATFPQALVEPCVKAGCPEGGVVLDPFLGSGTTALVARRLGRRSIGIELNAEYAALAARRLQQLSLLA